MYLRQFLSFILGIVTLSGQVSSYQQWTASVADSLLNARSATIAGIQSETAAEIRKAQVRSLMLSSLGGFPPNTPLNAQLTGAIDRGSFRIEKVLFESQPGLRVSANVYIPQSSGSGPFPAILFQIGHFQNGKAWEQLTASNLAMKGFVVIAFDPLCQAERLQGYNPATGTTLIDWGVPQHVMAGGQSALVGHSLARYMINDARRAIDYLLTRSDVDGNRIGATGCSGGGTLTMFVAALDDRIKAAAPACSAGSFKIGFPYGLGDSEQSWLNFLIAGLDHPDFAEVFAPKTFLVLANDQDTDFPLSGVNAFYNEAKAWYGLYNASANMQLFVGPGPHGTPLEVREAIYSWMIQWLKNGVGSAKEAPVTLLPDSTLQVTPINYVAGLDLFSVIAATSSPFGSIPELLNLLQQAVRYTPQVSPPVYGTPTDNGSYITQPFTFSPEQGITLNAAFLIPKTAGQKPGAVYFETDVIGSAGAVQLALNGNAVLAIMPRAFPRVDGFGLTGEWDPATRAWLIGRNLPCMRAKDLMQGIDILMTRPEVLPGNFSLFANGVQGIAALYAAAVDQRTGTVIVDRTPYSFAAAFNSAVHYDLHSALIPGVYPKWDVSSVVLALGRRKVIWTNPTDWLHNVVSSQATTPRLNAVVAAKGVLGPQYYVDLSFTNSGPGAALSTAINAITLRTLAGTGVITFAGSYPIAVGSLAAGSSTTVRVLLNVPASVTRFSITESGNLTTGIGGNLTFSLSQAVIR